MLSIMLSGKFHGNLWPTFKFIVKKHVAYFFVDKVYVTR